MDWTAGYASDIEYTAGFYREQSPTYLNFACALNGYEPVSIDQSFTYCELGFGRGLTVSMLAAANPQGQFYATDFNPGHVAGARELAARAELSNLTLLEDSFDELAAGKHPDLPQFDFITLHGIYTWVTRENRGHIVTFIKRYLKPGGLVYLSYNAQPGWTAALPLQRLLVEFGDAFPNRSDLQVKGASELISRMEAAGAGYLSTNPGLSRWLDTIKTGNINYLVHEYMHKHWEPLYHADVARDLAEAKLDFAGSADLALTYPAIFLSKEKLAVIDTMTSASMQETMKDYFQNTSFRKDVFVRGKRQMKPLRKVEVLQKFGIALLVPRSTVSTEMKLTFGTVHGKDAIYIPIIDALATRPHTFGELQLLPALAGVLFGDIVQAGAYLCAAGKAEVYWDDKVQQDAAPAQRMNSTVSAMARHADELQALSSPVLGSGIIVGLIERMAFHHFTTSGADANHADTVKAIFKMLREQGRTMNKDGVAVTSEADNLEEIGKLVTKIFAEDLPLWRRLGML